MSSCLSVPRVRAPRRRLTRVPDRDVALAGFNLGGSLPSAIGPRGGVGGEGQYGAGPVSGGEPMSYLNLNGAYAVHGSGWSEAAASAVSLASAVSVSVPLSSESAHAIGDPASRVRSSLCLCVRVSGCERGCVSACVSCAMSVCLYVCLKLCLYVCMSVCVSCAHLLPCACVSACGGSGGSVGSWDLSPPHLMPIRGGRDTYAGGGRDGYGDHYGTDVGYGDGYQAYAAAGDRYALDSYDAGAYPLDSYESLDSYHPYDPYALRYLDFADLASSVHSSEQVWCLSILACV